MSKSSPVLVTSMLDGKPLSFNSREHHKIPITPCGQFGTVGVMLAVNSANSPITCVKAHEDLYFHETFQFNSGVREYMVYWLNQRGHSVYVKTVYSLPIVGETTVIPATRATHSDISINGAQSLYTRVSKLFP